MSYLRKSQHSPVRPSMDLSSLAGVLLAFVVVMIAVPPPASTRRAMIPTYAGECFGGEENYCGVTWHTVMVPAAGSPYLVDEPGVTLEPWSTVAGRVRQGPPGNLSRWRVRAADGAPVQSVIDVLDHLDSHQLGPATLVDFDEWDS